MPRDAIFGGAVLLLCAAYFWMAAQIPRTQLADAIGPQGLPRAYALILAALSIALIVRSIGDRGSGIGDRGEPRGTAPSPIRDPRPPTPDPRSPIPSPRSPIYRAMGMIAIGVAYLLAAPYLGYALSVAGLILATTYYQGGTLSRQVALVAIAGALFFWLLFVVILGIPQPPGLWRFVS